MADGEHSDSLCVMFGRALSVVRDFVLDRAALSEARGWHEVSSLFPVKLRDGSRSKTGGGRLWRRAVKGQWEYRQDPYTLEDFDSDTW